MNVTILGAGAFGSALGAVLTENGHVVQYFDPYKYPEVTLTQALTFDKSGGAQVIVLAVPSGVAPSLLPELPAEVPLICATKGFLTLAPFQRFRDFSVLSGPAFASQLQTHQTVMLTATSRLVPAIFANDWLGFDQTTDQLGVLICGSLKNIYAIGAGLRQLALESDAETMQSYLQSALTELKLILSANRADPNTAKLACGKGDLTLTCSSAESRNYRFGQMLASGASTVTKLPTTEGLSTLQTMPTSFKIPDDCTIYWEIYGQVQDYLSAVAKKGTE